MAATSRTITGSSSSWCWVVALASFWTNFCLLGVLRSSAVVYVALVDNFDASRENAAWPSGVFGFTMCLTGAFSGCLCQCFRIRTIMLVAATFAALSVSLCCLATNMQHIVILYGAFQGIGIGLIVPLTHVILNEHFVEHRAVAMGIAYAGSSAGSFTFPALTQLMITEYGLSGTFLLLGGIMLNSVLGISLFRDSLHQTCSPAPSIDSDSKIFIQDGGIGGRKLSPSKRSCKIQKSHSWNSVISDNDLHDREERKRPTGSNALTTLKKIHNGNSCSVSTQKYNRFRQDSLEKLMMTAQLTFQVLVNPCFLTISLAFAVYFSSSAIFLMIIVDHAIDIRFTKSQGVFLVSAFSFGDLMGRLGCGWIADLKCIERKQLVIGYLVIMGSLLAIIPLCHTYQGLTTLSVLLGIFNGSVIVNYSVIVAENLGLQKLAMAMGISTFIIGSSAFLRPVVIGYFRDRNRSYDLLFTCLGASQIAVTLIWLIESALHRKRQRTAASSK